MNRNRKLAAVALLALVFAGAAGFAAANPGTQECGTGVWWDPTLWFCNIF